MHPSTFKGVTKVIHNKRNVTFWDYTCRVESHMDSCLHCYVKQKHEMSSWDQPNSGNVVTAAENCNVKIPFHTYHFQDTPFILLQACLTTLLQGNFSFTTAKTLWNFFFAPVRKTKDEFPSPSLDVNRVGSKEHPKWPPAHECKHWLC